MAGGGSVAYTLWSKAAGSIDWCAVDGGEEDIRRCLQASVRFRSSACSVSGQSFRARSPFCRFGVFGRGGTGHALSCFFVLCLELIDVWDPRLASH